MADNRIVFHYNRAHNIDPSIPPWVVKYKGETIQVHHLNSLIGFSTKETPDNPSTKAALLFRGTLSVITTPEGTVIATISK